MENASKALIIAASTLIAVILMSFMVYMFRKFGATAKNTEKRYSAQEIEAFNAKFIGYETGGKHILNDTVAVTYYRGRSGAANTETTNYEYTNIFNRNGPFASYATSDSVHERYIKSLVAASQVLNTGYDVVTAINDAIDINDIVNNGYTYGTLEIESSVEIIVDLNGYQGDLQLSATPKRYLLIEPNKQVKAKNVYETNSISTTGTNSQRKKYNAEHFSISNKVSVYTLLEKLRDTKIISQDEKPYTVYKYYFFGEVITNNSTGLVETVKFTLVKDKKFDDPI